MSARLDPATMPVLRVEFRLPDGDVIERTWNMAEAATDPLCARLREGVPEWLENPRKAWAHPQDPITFKGNVRPGHEAEAREFAAPNIEEVDDEH